MHGPFGRTESTPEGDACPNCGQRAPGGPNPDAMAEVAALKNMLSRTRGHLDDDLRYLEQRLNQYFNRIGEKLEALESNLRPAASSKPEAIPESVPEAAIETSAPAIPGSSAGTPPEQRLQTAPPPHAPIPPGPKSSPPLNTRHCPSRVQPW